METFENMIKRYGGKEVSLTELSGYKNWALNFFHRPEFITEPNLGFTLQLDISAHELYFSNQRSVDQNGSLTALLTYYAFRAVRKFRELNFRYLNGKWYEFNSIPLYFPIAVPEPERFRSVLIENVETMTFEEFSKVYHQKIKAAQVLTWAQNEINPFLFEISLFIGNLPNLYFTSLVPHQRTLKTGAPMIYFGKRYRVDGKLHTPLFFGGDHSTFDPVILDQVIQSFSALEF